MKLVFVEHTFLTTKKVALIVRDEEHLKELIASREEAARSAQFKNVKIARTKAGQVDWVELSKDWDPFRQSPYDPYS